MVCATPTVGVRHQRAESDIEPQNSQQGTAEVKFQEE